MPSSTVDNIAALSSGMPFAKAMAKMIPWRCTSTRVHKFASPVSIPVYIVILTELKLHDHHLEDLIKRGISEAVI